MPLFNRVASVIVESSGSSVEITGLRLVFSIEKTKTSTQNVLKLKIYNLSDDTSAKVQEKDSKIILKVGYEEDTGEEIIFSGSITRVNSLKDFPNTVLDIESGDGMDKLREARSNISNTSGVSVTQILSQLSEDLGVVVKEITKEIQETFNNGFSFVGPTKVALDDISKQFGLEWSIQDGELQILKEDSSNKDRISFISKDTGMIGSPELVVSDSQVLQLASSGKPRYRIDTLMNPKIRPTNEVEVESIPISGNFLVNSVKHSGDTHGDTWNTTMEVTES